MLVMAREFDLAVRKNAMRYLAQRRTFQRCCCKEISALHMLLYLKDFRCWKTFSKRNLMGRTFGIKNQEFKKNHSELHFFSIENLTQFLREEEIVLCTDISITFLLTAEMNFPQNKFPPQSKHD